MDENQDAAGHILPFKVTLAQHDLTLTRNITHTLQVNLGFLCNQVCRHCHLDAGPGRQENMAAETVDAVIAYAARSNFETIDITGGAPELNPHLPRLIEEISPHAARIMLRSNLSAMKDKLPLSGGFAAASSRGDRGLLSFGQHDPERFTAGRRNFSRKFSGIKTVK